MPDDPSAPLPATITPPATSQLDYFNFVLAIIGCITGLSALGWNIWDATLKREDKIEAHVGEEGRRADGTWSIINLYVDVTNVGQRPVYVKSAMVIWEEKRSGDGYPLTSTERPEAPIQPGGYRRYKLRPLTMAEFENRVKNSKGAGTVWVITSRGLVKLPVDNEFLKVILWSSQLAEKYIKAPAAPK